MKKESLTLQFRHVKLLKLAKIRELHIFHLWVNLSLSRKDLFEVNFKSKPCFLNKYGFKHKPEPLSLCLRAKKVDGLFLLSFQNSRRSELRNFFRYFVTKAFATPEII